MKNENLEYNGHCAFAVSTGKIDVKGGNNFATINDKNYSFSNAVAKLLFRILPNRIKKADDIWSNNI